MDLIPECHCWADGPDDEDDMGTTCLLPEGHLGPHEWTREDEIVITVEWVH